MAGELLHCMYSLWFASTVLYQVRAALPANLLPYCQSIAAGLRISTVDKAQRRLPTNQERQAQWNSTHAQHGQRLTSTGNLRLTEGSRLHVEHPGLPSSTPSQTNPSLVA
jgi:hypothetical protein